MTRRRLILLSLVVLTAMALMPASAGQSPKNVIYMIGDGMGLAQVTLARLSHDAPLNMDSMPSTAFVKTQSADATVTFPARSDSASGDGDLVSCRVGPDGSVLGLFFINGGFFTAAGDTLAVLSPPATFRADFSNPVAAEGYIVTSTSTTVALPRFAASRVTFNGEPVTVTAWGEGAVFTVTGNGPWRAELGLAPPSNLRVDDVQDDQGHQLQLTWTLSPDDRGGHVTAYLIFRSRSPVLTDPVPLSRFTSLDSLAVWEARATVLVDSVGAGIGEYLDTSVTLNGVIYYYWLQATGPGGASKPVAAHIPTAVRESPRAFRLGNPYPNPFNPSTVIPFTIARDARVTLTVYNTTGAKAAVLLDHPMRTGSFSAVWNTSGMPSGLYFVTLRAGGRHIATRKLLLLK